MFIIPLIEKNLLIYGDVAVFETTSENIVFALPLASITLIDGACLNRIGACFILYEETTDSFT
jgi:hypothetical protein